MDDYFAGSIAPAPVPVPEAQAFTRVGWAPPPGTPPGWGAPVAQGWTPPVATGRSGGQKVLIALVVGVAAFVALGVLAAIAIPVFLNQRTKAEAARTTVAAPESVLDMPHLTDAVSAAGEAKMLGLPGPGHHVAGVYGAGDVTVVVGAAKFPMGYDDREGFLDGAKAEARGQGITLHEVAAGALGGTVRCGESPSVPMTLCVFVDAGSYGIVAITGPSDNPAGTARAAREAFVHRT